ncbi:TRAP-type mannitol/chloroaromatic compound transport system, substrate-binding protein [Tistlia consotensis]|uniref:TRAP-type mannitol/chloroaromatic compound transport system, substrate-binding protein n=1 Tax=Tistlia consotensis USBA 355 TaxID=560819 RepID=A0A1Y6B6S3_9PROT|nr:TRAP transporter substrate-binding protein [Tistlia consotensis]SME91222.1 TRAP-type mannitol/chloroaromatic compound transport system, substrate-binding protein [Tistlia consotensis USBA 355]SNR27212.1 TRAP-type mannitol/chloroaromatic compound transport system, substrate-binding protein [Tistlia consotensis]
MTFKTLLVSTAFVVLAAMPAANAGQKTHLRIQTHYGPETISGKNAAQFVDDVQTMSNGDISIEMFYSSSVVSSVETFDAAANGILDCDMTGGAYQTGKDPAFQFVGDIMGGYETPFQQLGWLYTGGGLQEAEKLYNKYGMQLIGWWVVGQESLVSTKPLKGVADLKNWKFRSPPGMETKIFEKLGAKPIVMDFTEVFTALQSGIIDGADASILANNKGMGLYDVAKNATYPGFHSMPSDHLACNKAVWDAMPDYQKRIMETAMQKLALQQALTSAKANAKAARELKAAGVKIWDWSPEDRLAFRKAAIATWSEFATTPEAKALVASHEAYLKSIDALPE